MSLLFLNINVLKKLDDICRQGDRITQGKKERGKSTAGKGKLLLDDGEGGDDDAAGCSALADGIKVY